MLTHHQRRQAWLIKQLTTLESARREPVDEVAVAVASHPYAPIIEKLAGHELDLDGDTHRCHRRRQLVS
jgi:hypothetical protein